MATVPTIFRSILLCPNELIAEVDKDAKANYRTRSQQINMT